MSAAAQTPVSRQFKQPFKAEGNRGKIDMAQKKVLTTEPGAPVPNIQQFGTAGPGGPVLMK